MIDLNSFATFEAADIYHRRAAEYMSSHQLADFIRCPLLHRRKALGLIADADSNAFTIGRAAHVQILEGLDRYQAEFAVGGPINPATGRAYGSTTKAFEQWAAAIGKPVLTEDQDRLIGAMASAVSMHDDAVDLISYGKPEAVVRATWCDIPCQIRVDWFETTRPAIVDLKTCDDLTWFEADARRFRYAIQFAFYRAIVRQATGVELPVYVIAVEKKEPYRCGVWRVSDDTLAVAEAECVAALRAYRDCRDEDRWPTGYEATRILDL